MRGRIAVVTGVTSGIGRAITKALLNAGATVAGVGRDEARLRAEATELGAAFIPVVADLADEKARERAIAELGERFERVHLLVNNAAECVYELPLSLPKERWRRLFDINVLAALELTQALVPRMKGEGHVVNVSSVTARFVPNAKFSPYALTKATLSELTDAMRLELEQSGVKVTAILPGLVDTPIYDKVAGFAKTQARIKEQLPRWLDAQDVAETVMWAIGRPAHVVVGEIVLLPKGQAR